MALIQCIECGKEISSTAEHCPYCGIPLKVMISSYMPQPEHKTVLNKQGSTQSQPEESVQQYQTQPGQFVQQYQQTQPSPQPGQQYQYTQQSPQPVQQYQYTQQSSQQKPEKKPISFTKPAITLVICIVLDLICSFAGDAIGGIVGANIFGLGELIEIVGAGAFILIIVRVVEYGYRKLKK